MSDLDYGATEAAFGAAQGTPNVGDDQLAVKFEYKAKEDKEKTLAAGRPIFKEVVYIDIRVPGSRGGVVRPIRAGDKERFPAHYAAFMARQDQPTLEGTLLEEWPGIKRSQVEELKFMRIHTVEQLAGMNDGSSAAGLMGVQVLKSKAKAYLEHAKDNAAAQALVLAEERNKEMEAKLEAMEEKLSALLAAAPKPKRKRRTKAEMDAEKAEDLDGYQTVDVD